MRLLIVDGDDTLWATGHLYEHAYDLFVEYLAGYLDDGRAEPLDTVAARKALHAYDAQQARALGLSSHRMTDSMLHVAEVLRGSPLGPHAVDFIKKIGQYPFTQVSPPMAGARGFLQGFVRRKIESLVLTAGDPAIQGKRLRDFPYVHLLDGARIEPKKTPEVFREILQDHLVEPHEAWMVGNSYYSDIQPARAAGLHTAWLQSYGWAYDHVQDADWTGVIIGDTLKSIQQQIYAEEGL